MAKRAASPRRTFLWGLLGFVSVGSALATGRSCSDESLTVEIYTDSFPEETSWTVTNTSTGAGLAEIKRDTLYATTASLYFVTLCVPDGRYEFQIKDQYEDGICCEWGEGSYSVEYGGVEVASGGDFRSSETATFGPTVSMGSALATGRSCNEESLTVEIYTDSFPEETSWTVTNTCTGAEHAEIERDTLYATAASLYSVTLCVPEGRYEFRIEDQYEDGICCEWGEGAYSVEYGGVEVVSGGDFRSSETATFGSCPPTLGPTSMTGAPSEGPAASTGNPTAAPTSSPVTESPTRRRVTGSPSEGPAESTAYPTAVPTSSPVTESPTRRRVTGAPSKGPAESTGIPTAVPTSSPFTESPTRRRVTGAPSEGPAESTAYPTAVPTSSPVTESPTRRPVTGAPSKGPAERTAYPTAVPTSSPVTESPTRRPLTGVPSKGPVESTAYPTAVPTSSPVTESPTRRPVTGAPSEGPAASTAYPTAVPTSSPVTESPTGRPVTGAPSKGPAAETEFPTASSTEYPTAVPTSGPVTEGPTGSPTASAADPTDGPTSKPSRAPIPGRIATPTYSPNAFGATFVPGDLSGGTCDDDKLALSRGMGCRRLTSRRESVVLSDGTLSRKKMHGEADGAGVIGHPDGGWYYVSNSELPNENGGVGTLRFDAQGELIGYERTLEGTSRNCGGGTTYWDTWVSCEENKQRGGPGGYCYEVDPHTGYTSLVKNVNRPGNYESFAYDDKDPDVTARFFTTEDDEYGALVRYTPAPEAFATGDNSDILKTDGGDYDYLVLDDVNMTFRWSPEHAEGSASAGALFPYNEGIDVHNRVLNFVSKTEKKLLTLDLAGMTWSSSSTLSGLFDVQPDQLGRLVDDGGEVLYFCEDGDSSSDVHGRNVTTGEYFTIVRGDGHDDENTGLAFSPDNMFLYTAWQAESAVYAFWRLDGLPFSGQVAYTKYHSSFPPLRH